MFYGNKKRIDEDLQRIRDANLDTENSDEKEKVSKEEKRKIKESLKEITFKDFIAMVIAVFSIIIPYLLIFIGVLGLFVLFFYLIYLR